MLPIEVISLTTSPISREEADRRSKVSPALVAALTAEAAVEVEEVSSEVEEEEMVGFVETEEVDSVEIEEADSVETEVVVFEATEVAAFGAIEAEVVVVVEEARR